MSQEQNEREWLTTRQAAARMGVTDATLRNLIRAGQGPVAYRIGSELRFRVTDLDAFLAACRIDPEARAS